MIGRLGEWLPRASRLPRGGPLPEAARAARFSSGGINWMDGIQVKELIADDDALDVIFGTELREPPGLRSQSDLCREIAAEFTKSPRDAIEHWLKQAQHMIWCFAQFKHATRPGLIAALKKFE